MNKSGSDVGAGLGLRKFFAAVLVRDEAALAANSHIFVRLGECLQPATILAIGQRLRRGGEMPSPEQPLRKNDVAMVEIDLSADDCLQVSALSRITPVELCHSETEICFASGVVVPKWKPPNESRQLGMTVWLTGLSGAGKTTIAEELARRLRDRFAVEMLDADVVRTTLCKDLGYTREDRDENVRRLGFLARLLTQAGAVAVVSAISPYRAAREEVRKQIGRFIEVYVNAPLEVCESRDVKGLYQKARRGEVPRFTGIADPYEPPPAPEVECRTDRENVEESVAKVLAAVEGSGDRA